MEKNYSYNLFFINKKGCFEKSYFKLSPQTCFMKSTLNNGKQKQYQNNKIVDNILCKICLKIVFLIFVFSIYIVKAQVENVPVVNNPVYDFLLQIETKGILPHYSLSQLPLQKKTIISALKLARDNDSLLTNIEKKVLTKFEKEYQIISNERAVAVSTEADTNSIFSSKIWQDYDKSFYYYSDSNSNVAIIPLGSVEYFIKNGKTDNNLAETDNNSQASNLFMGTLGLRLSGTLSNQFGYYFQFTNSAVLKGDSSIALIDNKYATSKQFTFYKHDADISESHIAYQKDWFYASIGRETRLFGAGLDQRLIINNAVSPSFDAITLKAKFKTFEYTFSHNSLLNLPDIGSVGAFTIISPKYTAQNSFTFLPSWGEISFFQSVIYARSLELGYLIPISFLKTLETNLGERDKVDIGFTTVVRPVKNFQIKATWYLDDLKFSEIGNSYWGNKTAWNIAAITSAIPNINLGIEYTRVEPYTFSHFNPQNSATTDGMLFCSTIQPNSDRITALLNLWWGEKYPLQIKYSHTRYGKNIYDADGNLIKNVGGDPFISRRYTDEIIDSYYVTFLDGDLNYYNRIDITAGYEIFRGLSIHFSFSNSKIEKYYNYYRVLFRIYDF